MPEGDSVVRTARLLDRALAGQRLIGSDFRVPALATLDLSGAQVEGTRTRGKHLLTDLTTPDGALVLHSHLGMDGRWQEARTGAGVRGSAHLVRVVLRTPRGQVVGSSLRTLEVLPAEQVDERLRHLGPDLAEEGWARPEGLARLVAAGDRPVGEALLDQRVVAGLGTVLVSESCFLRGVSPLRPVGEVADPQALLTTASRVLVVSIARGFRTTTGDRQRGRDLWVYGREGQPCRRCGTPVRRSTVGVAPRQRSLWWCPSCQS